MLLEPINILQYKPIISDNFIDRFTALSLFQVTTMSVVLKVKCPIFGILFLDFHFSAYSQ